MAKSGNDAQTNVLGVSLRPYEPGDEDAAVALWLRTWQAAYPAIDFATRLGWWRERWRQELVPAAEIVVAEAAGGIIGFVTVDPRTRYLDQIVVAPEFWRSGVGSALVAAAARLSPEVSIWTSTPTMRVPYASMKSAAFASAVAGSIRFPASRYTA